MIIRKIIFHICCAIKKLWLKAIYRNKVEFNNAVFRKGFNLVIEAPGKVNMGQNVFFNNYCSINIFNGLRIGDGCIFGEGVRIYDHNHRFSDVERPIKEQGYTSEKITIGKHCWIGSNVLILKGAKIGSNCTIGAGCIIKENT